jgi:hypothetical protein
MKHNHSSSGVPRVTPEELEYGNFDVFDDPDKPYASRKFQYSNKALKPPCRSDGIQHIVLQRFDN